MVVRPAQRYWTRRFCSQRPRMTNPNDEKQTRQRISSFGIRASFVIRHSCFVIYLVFQKRDYRCRREPVAAMQELKFY
jgi:hypothetical protein